MRASNTKQQLLQILPNNITQSLRRIKRWYRMYPYHDWERKCRSEFFHNAFKALTFNGIDGDYAEFGCHSGMTFGMAYTESRRHGNKAKLWAFDSFQGFPSTSNQGDEHPFWTEGGYAMSLKEFEAICKSYGIPPTSYRIVPGFYDQTLPVLSTDEGPNNIALAYIDCDMYSSTKTVLEFLKLRLKHGMIIAFDDYFCWSKSQISGERKAMIELLGNYDRWELLPYLQYGWGGASFVVEDRRLISST